MNVKAQFAEKGDEFILENEMNLIDPITKKEFLSILPLGEVDTNKLKPIGNVPKANMLMQQLPLAVNFAQNESMKGAFKVIFPEGATGTMMKYNNGMLGTPLVGGDKKITAHAGLVPLESISLTPLMVFTAMSAITGQYFMARIDESLELISKDVKTIIDLIYDEKESDSLTAYNFYEYVKKNLHFVLGNETLKLSTLTNIQSNNNKMYSNILFYSKSINRETENLNTITSDSMFTGKRLVRMDEISGKISNLMKQQHLSFELFCIGKVIEMQLAEVYDNLYCQNLINELKVAGELIDKDVNNLLNKSEEVLLKIIKESAIKGNDAISKFNENAKQYKRKQIEFEKSRILFTNNINDFSIDNQKPKEFIVMNDLVYV